MSRKVAELASVIDGSRDGLAKDITQMWDNYNSQRAVWVKEKTELRDFIFSTDTTKTSNSRLPWRNSTVIPKITQIRDNLHANYMGALFPNDDWQRWEAYSEEDAEREKRNIIQAYVANKTRESDYRNTVSELVYDYIDYGNCFGEVGYVDESFIDEDGEVVAGYQGPKLFRISPLDIVFNPTASSFDKTWKIVRSIKTLGEIKRLIDEDSELSEAWAEVVARREDIITKAGSYSAEDWDKASGFQVDGFGSMQEYFGSGYVEILRFEGDIHDEDGNLLINHRVVVIDRSYVVYKKQIPSWFGASNIKHTGWRKRTDNLYHMGPLDNLVGMQYRLNHLENSKADALDQFILPPKVIKGEVEDFEWGPNAEIHIDEEGSVEILRPELSGIMAANSAMFDMMNMMEEFAGAPKQAMGIRTPGEKTAFEVQALENAAGRIFQDKVTNFEINMVEPTLNLFLESAKRNLDTSDVIRVMDDDLGVVQFIEITKEDITAKGKIRPIGARHFAARAQVVQNLVGISNTMLWQQIAPHVSTKTLAKMVEEMLQFNRFDLVSDHVGLFEQAETQRLSSQIQEDLMVENMASQEEIDENEAI